MKLPHYVSAPVCWSSTEPRLRECLDKRMGQKKYGVKIVTGDYKVVEKNVWKKYRCVERGNLGLNI